MACGSCIKVASSPGEEGWVLFTGMPFVECIPYYFVSITILVPVIDDDLCKAFKRVMCSILR